MQRQYFIWKLSLNIIVISLGEHWQIHMKIKMEISKP